MCNEGKDNGNTNIILYYPFPYPIYFLYKMLYKTWKPNPQKRNVIRACFFMCVRLLTPLVMVKGYPPSKASVLRWAVPIKVVPPRRILVARGGASSDREMSFNAMDSTGRTVMC